MKKTTAFITFPLVLAGCFLAASASDLEKGFRAPPDSARPWVFWLWSEYGHKDAITKDLEALRKQGVGGLLFGDGDPGQLSAPWREGFRHLVREAARLGFEFNANVANGFGTGGPWTTPEMAAKKLVYSELQVDGPQRIGKALPMPPLLGGYYRDVAVVAFRERENRPMTPLSVEASSTLGGYVGEWNFPAWHVLDRDRDTIWKSADAPSAEKPAWLDLQFFEPLPASGLYVAPAADGGPKDCELQVSESSGQFRTVSRFAMEKGQAKRLSFPRTTASRFRLLIRSAHVPDVQVAEVWLLREGDEPYLRHGLKWWAFKSGNRSFWDYPKQGPLALREEYSDNDFDLRKDDVIDLTARMDRSGRLAWEAPAGRWTVLRFGFTIQGTPPRSSASGYELDMYKAATADATFANVANVMIEEAGPLTGKTFSAVHLDSYEYGVSERGQLPTWTDDLPEQFHQRRGYDLLPYMPVLAGRIIESRELSNRFLWDYRRTMGDLYTLFYARLRELAHRHNLEANSESGYGTYPFPHIDGLEAFGAGDVPQGEFWTATPIMSQFYPFCDSVRTAASAAHIYGKRKIQSEAFSTWLRPYEAHPGLMKRFGDEAFSSGLQQCVIFCSTNQTGGVPGTGTGGYEIVNRHVTWFKQSKAFFDYLARIQYLLLQGQFVADALYFYGEGATTFVPGRDFVKPALPKGYDFDGLNAEVLLNRLSVKSDRLVLPHGMSYRVLVLPEEPEMSPLVLRKIRDLIDAGATVVGNRPLRAPGLTGYPAVDAEVKTLAREMWGPEEAPSGSRTLGRGRLIWGKDMARVFEEIQLEPDLEVKGGQPDANIVYTHRKTDAAEIYFLSNQRDAVADVQLVFRVGGKQPEIWDPVTGRNWDATDFHLENGRTAAPMSFAPYQSLLVVFRKPGGEPKVKRPNFPVASSVVELAGAWTVKFDPKWGGPESVVFETLTDWTKRPEEGIKYYSGTAKYRKTFDLPASWKPEGPGISLDLGDLNSLAEVRLNGKDLGVLWTKPFRIDVTGWLKASANILEIDIVNVWTNRLIGDAGLPAEKRYTKTDMGARFKKGDPLVSSGLLGPVMLKVMHRR